MDRAPGSRPKPIQIGGRGVEARRQRIDRPRRRVGTHRFRLIERAGTVISQIATEQLEMILVTLDGLRDHLIATIRDGRTSEERLLPFETDPSASGTVVPRSVIPTETARSANAESSPEDYAHSNRDPRQKSLWDEEADE